jgi:hypothetical protein
MQNRRKPAMQRKRTFNLASQIARDSASIYVVKRTDDGSTNC